MNILVVSLGCDKNSVDSEVMLGYLFEEGHTFTDDEEAAEAAIVNTCCFIGDAKEESIETVLALGKRRLSGQYKALLMTGCLAQRYFDEIHKELPEVDAIVTNTAISHIGEALDNVLRGMPRDYQGALTLPLHGGAKRILTTGGYYDYLKIADGCDKRCTYCIIPTVRGPYRSIPMEELVSEARDLAERGVRELCLIAQETTVYGVDLYGQKSLPQLLQELCRIEALSWIRLLYCYPEEITDELIAVIASEKKVLPYLDIPVQSGSDRILAAMGRRTNRAQILTLIQRLRSKIPDICLRTTLIAGFPGEEASDHKATLSFIKEASFDRLGVFCYSAEEGTAAAALPNQVSKRVMRARRDELMRVQQRLSFEKAEALIGYVLPVIVEGYLPEEAVYVGRSFRDAPDVDGYVFFSAKGELLSGTIGEVMVTAYEGYDLIGEWL